MCGRYVLRKQLQAEKALQRLGAHKPITLELPLRYNVAPTQLMPVVRGGAVLEVATLKWGHFVSFAPGGKPTFLVNARSESAATKPTFKQAIAERRCVVPADGFYEWKRSDGGKTKVPFLIQMKDERTFWIAGVFWPDQVDQPANYLLLTTTPNAVMSPIHDRMPVILTDEAAQEWLTPGPLSSDRLAALCAPHPADEMFATQVSAIVNTAANDVAECVMPVLASEPLHPTPPASTQLGLDF